MAVGGLEVPDIVVTVEAVAGIAGWWLTPTGHRPRVTNWVTTQAFHNGRPWTPMEGFESSPRV
jgi:hypothetical protein